MDEETKKLFPEVNPNINEVMEREKALDGEEVIMEEDKEEKTEQKDIFVTKKSKPKKNVKLEVGEKKEKKDKYAHLAAARQKGD